MNKLTVVALAILAAGAAAVAQPSPLTLWYDKPAVLWTDALPVGNGRIGAMIFGGAAHERIQFNESTVWTGEPHDYAHKGASQSLAKIRELLWAGKQKEAEDLANKEFMSEPLHQKAYQSLGDLIIETPGATAPANYKRSLDLDTGIATTEFTAGGIDWRREVFASHPANAIVVRVTSSKPAPFTVSLKCGHANCKDGASLSGQVADSAIRFDARFDRRTEGTSSTFILTAATNFKTYRDVSADPAQRNAATLAAIGSKSYEALRAEHIRDHQALFRRVALDLGATPAAKLPTDERIAAFSRGSDPALVTLLFQFGRYLMIAGSRPGGQPTTLQGLWNDSNKPAWDSKYTDNINTEMNYWPVEETNLSECHLPLFDALKELAQSGAVTAREHYNARGWVLHHNFDLWRGTAPINASNHGIWQTGGAWLSTHLWEHYLFTGDREFLRTTAYPLMKGASQFFVDALVKDPKTGFLYTGPSNSPEQGGLVMGPTMDREIVRTLFGETIAAAKALNVDAELRDRLSGMRKQIAPLADRQPRPVAGVDGRHRRPEQPAPSRLAPLGRLPGQRGHAVRHARPVQGRAAIARLPRRCRHRLVDGLEAEPVGALPGRRPRLPDHAEPDHSGVGREARQSSAYLRICSTRILPSRSTATSAPPPASRKCCCKATTPTARPPACSAVQSGDAGFLHLLPALPSALPAGKVSGLLARGGFEVSLDWQNRQTGEGRHSARQSKPLKVRYAGTRNRDPGQGRPDV